MIDDEDFERVSAYTWNPIKSRNVTYARHGQTYLHRFIMNAGNGQIVDHINGNGLDNRRCNLRFASHQLNRANANHLATKKTCKYVGVSFRRGKFHVQIKINKKNKFFGNFDTAEDAARFYNKKVKEIYGDLSYQNHI